MDTFSALTSEYAAASLLGFAVVIVIGSLTFLPRIPLCLVGGMAFGLVAFPVSLVASTIGALLGFLVSRYLARGRIQRLVEDRPTWKAVSDAVDAEGLRLVFLMRLASPVPATVSNYLFGLTAINVWKYMGATFAGLIPSAFTFVYLGAAGRTMVRGSNSGPDLVFLVAGCILSIVMIWLVTTRARSLINARQAPAPENNGWF